MRTLQKTAVCQSGRFNIELWKTPRGYSVYICRGPKHEQHLTRKEALLFFEELVALL